MEFGIICDIFRKLWREVFPDVREDWFGPVCQPEKTALDCTRPVALSSVQSFAVLELVKTGLGLGPLLWKQKTGTDRTFKLYPGSSERRLGVDVLTTFKHTKRQGKGNTSRPEPAGLSGHQRRVAIPHAEGARHGRRVAYSY